MAPRALSTGTLSFGLVNIPVKVFSATDSSNRISFHQLDPKTHERLRQQLINPSTGEVVARDQVVKGYEYAKDQYVILSDEELDALEEEASKAIEISEFVPLQSVDPLFFESGYYLGPDKGAERSYALLLEALRKSGRAAVAHHTARGKQHLVLLRPGPDAIVMQQLRYADEVRAAPEMLLDKVQLKDAELALARQFIDQLSAKTFAPEKYQDTYRERLREVLAQKSKGETVTFQPPKEAPQVIDLMEALKASLAKAGVNPEKRKPPKRAPRIQAAPAKKSARGGKR